MNTKLTTIIIEGNADKAFSTVKLFCELLKDNGPIEVTYKDSPYTLTSANWFKVSYSERPLEKDEK